MGVLVDVVNRRRGVDVYQLIQQTVVQTVYPAAQTDFLAGLPGRLHDRGVGQTLHLFDDIPLDQFVEFAFGLQIVQFVLVQAIYFLNVRQPLVGNGQITALLAQSGFNTTAAIMAADDHMLDL